jgi:hypothetical protein
LASRHKLKNNYLPKNIHNPIATKARAATFLRIFWGMTAIKPSPKRTPISVTKHKARDAPTNTDKGSFVLEVIRMAANCVLSPSSAKKIVPKVVRKTFQSIAIPPQIDVDQSIVEKLRDKINVNGAPVFRPWRSFSANDVLHILVQEGNTLESIQLTILIKMDPKRAPQKPLT